MEMNTRKMRRMMKAAERKAEHLWERLKENNKIIRTCITAGSGESYGWRWQNHRFLFCFICFVYFILLRDAASVL